LWLWWRRSFLLRLNSHVTELIRRRKRYPALLGRHCNRALHRRLDADYRFKGVSQSQATQAVRWAEAFVAAITAEVTHGTENPHTP
jgi:hypothetical protein